MKRLLLVLTVGALMSVIMVFSAGPTFAVGLCDREPGLCDPPPDFDGDFGIDDCTATVQFAQDEQGDTQTDPESGNSQSGCRID